MFVILFHSLISMCTSSLQKLSATHVYTMALVTKLHILSSMMLDGRIASSLPSSKWWENVIFKEPWEASAEEISGQYSESDFITVGFCI